VNSRHGDGDENKTSPVSLAGTGWGSTARRGIPVAILRCEKEEEIIELGNISKNAHMKAYEVAVPNSMLYY
jgi:FAD/FMN-containing dehydrogenase